MSQITILITGAGGLLGQRLIQQAVTRYDVVRHFHHKPSEPLPLGCFAGDLTDAVYVADLAKIVAPEIIINCAALADVDGCEQEPKWSEQINVAAVRNLVTAFPESFFVQISTDYVFAGPIPSPRSLDPTGPMNIYGRHKLMGEEVARGASARNLIIRTATLIDHQGRRNIFSTVFESLQSGREVVCYTDQCSNPIAAFDAAELILDLVQNGAAGIFHIGGSDFLSRYDLAVRTADFFGLPRKLIQPSTLAAVRRLAPRPAAAGLDCRETEQYLERRMPSLEQAFARIKAERSV